MPVAFQAPETDLDAPATPAERGKADAKLPKARPFVYYVNFTASLAFSKKILSLARRGRLVLRELRLMAGHGTKIVNFRYLWNRLMDLGHMKKASDVFPFDNISQLTITPI